jgi:hypothetical protein
MPATGPVRSANRAGGPGRGGGHRSGASPGRLGRCSPWCPVCRITTADTADGTTRRPAFTGRRRRQRPCERPRHETCADRGHRIRSTTLISFLRWLVWRYDTQLTAEEGTGEARPLRPTDSGRKPLPTAKRRGSTTDRRQQLHQPRTGRPSTATAAQALGLEERNKRAMPPAPPSPDKHGPRRKGTTENMP